MTVSIYDAIGNQDATNGNKEGDSIYGAGRTATTWPTRPSAPSSSSSTTTGSDYTTSTDPSVLALQRRGQDHVLHEPGALYRQDPGRLQVNSTDPVATVQGPMGHPVHLRSGPSRGVPAGGDHEQPAGHDAGQRRRLQRLLPQGRVELGDPAPDLRHQGHVDLDPQRQHQSASGAVSRFYLANIRQENAGKTLILDLYDPGDGDCRRPPYPGCTGFTMQFRGPPSGASATCRPTRGRRTPALQPDGVHQRRSAGTLDGSSSSCTITTLHAGSNTGIYNGKWLRVRDPDLHVPGYTAARLLVDGASTASPRAHRPTARSGRRHHR